MTPLGELRREDLCLDFDGKKITMWGCHGLQGNQEWKYDKEVRRQHSDTF